MRITPPTPKQQALLQFLGIQCPESKLAASECIDSFITKARTEPTLNERLQAWHQARILLFPHLYQEEFLRFKASRADGLYHMNNGWRGSGAPIRRMTKAQVNSVVTWLDINHSGWDLAFSSDSLFYIPDDSFFKVFVPAVATLYPELIKNGYMPDDLSIPKMRASYALDFIPRAPLKKTTPIKLKVEPLGSDHVSPPSWHPRLAIPPKEKPLTKSGSVSRTLSRLLLLILFTFLCALLIISVRYHFTH